MELKYIVYASNQDRAKLLIVPYGIEINTCCLICFSLFLLIVPYGIEIADRAAVNVGSG